MKLLILIIFFSTTCICRAQINGTFASAKTNKVIVSPVFQRQKFSAFGIDSVARPKGLAMKRTGQGLFFGGPLLIIAGIAIVNNAYDAQEDIGVVLRQAGGSILIIVGSGATITGIVLWSVGAKRYKSNLEKQGSTTSFQWKGNALSLTYRF